MSGSNVVPWPMPSGFPAGCCPPGGDMNALLQCYCDIQAATAFISKIVTDLAANDPAFQKALVDGIAASGSNLPLIGVTNGADAQPGQVGENIQIVVPPVSFPATGRVAFPVSIGVLQPGDWDYWMTAETDIAVSNLQYILSPFPAGFSDPLSSIITNIGSEPEIVIVVSTIGRALISVPTLVVANVTTNNVGAGGPGPGNVNLKFTARRRR